MKQIPQHILKEVRERDGPFCRACGEFIENGGHHHLFHRGYCGLLPDGKPAEGNIDIPENIITVCICHSFIHSQNSNKYNQKFDREKLYWENVRRAK